MKRVRCPKCDNYITFDETKYQNGEKLVFQCPYCGKQFAIRIGVAKLRNTIKDGQTAQEQDRTDGYGALVVIENDYHYKQVFPLHHGDNVIGRYMKGCKLDCPIETDDLKIDMWQCVITVSEDKDGHLQYVLRDGPSYRGTYLYNERLGARDRRIIEDGALITVGESTLILQAGPSVNKR